MDRYEQLEFFPLTECEQLRKDLKKVQIEVGNLRRGLFARHGELMIAYDLLKKEIDEIKKTNETHVEEA